MAQFVGVWESDKSVPAQNMEGFMNAIGVGDRVGSMKDGFTRLTVSKDGAKWTLLIENNRFPAPKTYNIEMGKEFDDAGMEGEKMKVKVDLEGDNKMVETRDVTRQNNQSFHIITTREVVGDVMKVTMSSGGQSMTYQMKRAQ